MHRKNFFFRQEVTEGELDSCINEAEVADRLIVKEILQKGVISGLGVTQAASPNISVLIAAGYGYDADGQRLYIPNQQPLSLTTDSNGVSTSVASGGNAKVVSIFLQFTRALSDPRTDGNSIPVYFKEDESFALIVRQGAEATSGSEVAPGLESDKILLADIKRTFGQTQILNADINPTAYTNRRQDAFVGQDGGLTEWRTGKLETVISLLRDAVNDRIITPTALAGGNTDDYNPTGFATATLLRQDASSASVIRGILARKAGTRLRIFNISAANNITLNHQDTGDLTAANRIICPNNANYVIRPNGMGLVFYDGTSSRWRVEAA